MGWRQDRSLQNGLHPPRQKEEEGKVSRDPYCVECELGDHERCILPALCKCGCKGKP